MTTLGAFGYSNSLLPWGGAIGRYCSIAKGLKIFGAEHFVDWISTSPRFYINEHQSQFDASQITHKKRESRCVNIGHDVWIGSNVTLKKCITIGDGAIVGAGSIVTHDVEPFSVQSVHNKTSVHMCTRAIAHQSARSQIDNTGKAKPALVCWEISNISAPSLIASKRYQNAVATDWAGALSRSCSLSVV